MYTGMWGFGVALALVAANWSFVLVAAGIIVGFAIRAPREERMMVEAFGEQYAAYMRETGRFFPRAQMLLAKARS
jgi:protein-S-isoprenylcysteine O-methyltransferase Ste14